MACHLQTFSFISDLKSLSPSLGLNDELSAQNNSKPDEIDGWNNNSEVSEKVKNSPSCWPQSWIVSLSPFADAMVICNSRKAVFLKSKFESVEGEDRLKFSVVAEKTLIQAEGESITCVLCLPLASQRKSLHGGPDWTAVIFGFSNGLIRIYTEEGELLLFQQILEGPVKNLRYRNYTTSENIADLVVVGINTLAAIEGFVLLQTVRACRNQLARAKAGQGDQLQPDPLICKRWNLPDCKELSDCCIVGHIALSSFDDLVSESLQHGPSAYLRSTQASVSVVLSTSEDLFLGLYHLSDTRNQQALSDVASALASRIKTMLIPPVGNRIIGGIFGRNDSAEANLTATEPSKSINMRFGLYDKHRQGSQIYLSPDSNLAALTDTFGRVILFDIQQGLCIRMFKGYREAQCAWLEAKEDKLSNAGHCCKVVYLVIYAPKRGILEVWLAELGHRVAAFNVSKSARLLYPGVCIMGFDRTHRLKNMVDIFPCCLLEPNGNLNIIQVSFKSALLDSNSPLQQDSQLLREFGECLKGKSSEILADRIADIKLLLCKIQSCSVLNQCLHLLVDNNSLSADLFLDCVNSIIQHVDSSDFPEEIPVKLPLLSTCHRLVRLGRAFSSLSHLNSRIVIPDESNLPPDIQRLSESCALSEEDFDQLMSVTSLYSGSSVKQKRVSFAEEESVGVVGAFLRSFEAFDIKNDDEGGAYIQIKQNLDETNAANLGTFLFQASIKSASLFKESQIILEESGIAPENLLILLLCHWLKSGKIPHWQKWINFYNILRFCSNLNNDSDWIWLRKVNNLLSNCSKLGTAYIACTLIKSLPDFQNCSFLNLSNGDNKTENGGPPKKLNKAAIENNDASWEKLSREHFAISMVGKRLEDLMVLDSLLKAKCPGNSSSSSSVGSSRKTNELSISAILREGPGAISEIVAEWAVANSLLPEFFTKSVTATNDDVSRFEVIRGLYKEASKRFSRSMDSDAVLANISWEYMVRWKKEADEVSFLDQALNHMHHIGSSILKNGIACLMWKTFVLPRFEALALLIEKVGKTPKERLCKQEMSMSAIHLESFLEFCSNFLSILIETNIVSDNQEPLTPFPPEDLWRLEEDISPNGCPAPLVVLACSVTPSDYTSVYHHHILANAMLFILAFQLKNSRPLSLYDARGRQAFFQDLVLEFAYPMGSLAHSIVLSRTQFLNKVCAAIANSLPDTLPTRASSREKSNSLGFSSPLTNTSVCNAQIEASRWMNRVFAVAKGWDIKRDEVAQSYVCHLYSMGHDAIASEAISSVIDSTKLGPQLLLIAGLRIAHLVFTSSDQSGRLAQLSPTLSSWLKKMDLSSLRCLNTSLLDTKVLVGHSINLIPEEEPDHNLALSLFDVICNMIN